MAKCSFAASDESQLLDIERSPVIYKPRTLLGEVSL